MPLKDVLIAALSRPAGRVVDGPVRDIVAAALKERGYASPAEVAALKDEIAAVRAQAAALSPRLDQLDAKLEGARSESAALRDALAHAATAASEAQAAVVVSAPATVPIAVAPACRVTACGHAAVANGFCREHQLQWRSGRLQGFVSPEGLVDVHGRPGRVDLSSAGLPYQVADGRLKVAGRFAAVTLL